MVVGPQENVTLAKMESGAGPELWGAARRGQAVARCGVARAFAGPWRWSGVGGFRIGAPLAVSSRRSICMLAEAAILTGETAAGRQKVGQVLGGAIPDDGVIGIEVSVGQDVPEASNGPPGDLRLPRR